MIQIRKSEERGHFNFGWLDTYHTFSFSDYYDPKHMQWKHLRVLNEDVIAPDGGFPLHPHSHMEIFTFVASGALAHKDSLDNSSSIHPGKVQLMSAGSGIRHSEFNPSAEDKTHLLQIWITPREDTATSNYQELEYDRKGLSNALQLLASPDGREGSMAIRQNVEIYTGKLEAGKTLEIDSTAETTGWLQLISGELKLNGQSLKTGDGAGTQNAAQFLLEAKEAAEFLWFDMKA